jgi:PAS domain S-box-containing protein
MAWTLKSKIISITVIIILIMMVVFAVLMRTAVYGVLEEEIDRRAVAIGRHFAELSADAQLSDSTSLLQTHLKDYLSTESYLAYIITLDGQGAVQAHSFGATVPSAILAVVTKRDPGKPAIYFKLDDGTKLEDFLIPVGIGQGGRVHVGIYEDKIGAKIGGLITRFTPLFALLLLGGVSVAYLLASAITRPVVVLMEGVKSVTFGDLDVRINVRTRDEIGQLASSFNSMTEKLLATTVSRTYMEKLIDSMNDVLIVISPEGVISSVNRAYYELFGFEANAVIGRRVEEPGEQDIPSCTYSAFQHALEYGRLEGVESTCRTSDGTLVPMLFSLAVMKDAAGKPQAVICAAQNISNLKKVQHALQQKQSEIEAVNRNLEQIVASRTAELAVGNESLRAEVAERQKKTEELRAARDSAESANRAKSEFLANMSHEMRTPLNSIIGGTEYLEGTSLTPDQRRSLEMIRYAGDSLLVQVNDLIDLARIEAGQLELVAKEFNLADTLEATVHMLSLNADQKQQDLSLAISPDIPHFVVGDQARLQQVLVNLVANAIKFTGNGGAVAVSAYRGQSDLHSMDVCFLVRDTGIGIEPDKIGLIFDSFAQADSSITRRYGGSGLGLAISRRLVEAMGGSIKVESTPGTGSCFTFSIQFPLSGHAVSSQASRKDAAGNGSCAAIAADSGTHDRSRVLLVDDSLENRALMKLLLARQPLDLDEASNGREALDLFEQNEYSLILMDIQMPVLDGFSATRMIRRIEERGGGRRTPVVALTAHAYEADIRRCTEAGCDAHIAKPFKKKGLLECLSRYLPGIHHG